jgi:hypothetical protein
MLGSTTHQRIGNAPQAPENGRTLPEAPRLQTLDFTAMNASLSHSLLPRLKPLRKERFDYTALAEIVNGLERCGGSTTRVEGACHAD